MLRIAITSILITLAAASAASEAAPAIFIGGRVAPPPPLDAGNVAPACVTLTAMLSDGATATTRACGEAGEGAAAAWPFLLRVASTAHPPLAALVTASDAASGRTARKVMLVDGTAASIDLDWAGASVESGCQGAHTAAVVASSLAVAALLAIGLGLMVWGQARAVPPDEAGGGGRGSEGGGWSRARDGRLTRGK